MWRSQWKAHNTHGSVYQLTSRAPDMYVIRYVCYHCMISTQDSLNSLGGATRVTLALLVMFPGQRISYTKESSCGVPDGAYTNEPLLLSVTLPLFGGVTTTIVAEPLHGTVSLPRTPGPGMEVDPV